MRAITLNSVMALFSGTTWSQGNMSTSVHCSAEPLQITSLYLHGNLIAEKRGAGPMDYDILLSDCGWFTRTTLDRLNGILNHVDLPSLIGSVKGEQRISTEDWLGSVLLVVRNGVPLRIESTRANGDVINVPMRWAS